MTTVETKPWYKIKKDVEYSTDFDFFFENQICIAQRGSRYSFYSRLENKTFLIKYSISSDTRLTTETRKDENGKNIISQTVENYTMSDDKIKDICRQIHSEILEGKYGDGVFVD